MEKKQPKETRKIRYTKTVLRESLMELMKTKPITAISIKEICAKADLSRSTFYNYFTDQYDLLQKTEEEILIFIDSMFKKYAFHKNDTRTATLMVEDLLHYVADNNKSIYVLFSKNGNIDFQQELFISIYQRNYLKSMTDKLPDEKTKQCYFLFIVTGTIGIIYNWIKNGMDTPIHELAKLLIKITSHMK
jgi:AcrR family transcriptional regulator